MYALYDQIWDAGTSVQYYITAKDDAGNDAVFPADAPTTAAL